MPHFEKTAAISSAVASSGRLVMKTAVVFLGAFKGAGIEEEERSAEEEGSGLGLLSPFFAGLAVAAVVEDEAAAVFEVKSTSALAFLLFSRAISAATGACRRAKIDPS